MDESVKHRLVRWARLGLCASLLLQGVGLPWGVRPAAAASNPDTIQLGITPTDTVAPAAVTDLLASANPSVEGQVSLTWTAPQGNAGGTPIPNWPVASYVIHYATFSVASLAGDTTAWWNLTASSPVVLQPPGYVPQAPGQLEASTLSNLIPGGRYYFGLESVSQGGVTSPIDTESASPALQAWAVTTKFSTPTATPPLRPNGLSMNSSGGQFTLNWHAVTQDTNYQPVSIDHYVVNRYDAIGSSPTVSATVLAGSPLSYTDTVGGLTYYYTVYAVAVGGAMSVISDYVDSSPQMNRYAIAPDDITTRVVMPASVAAELDVGNNVYGDDLEIRLTQRPQDEVGVTLRSYDMEAYRVSSGVEVPYFAFAQTGMQVQLGLGAVLGAGRPLGQVPAGTTAGSITQIVSVYWFNGGSYIRISGPILTSDQALSVTVQNLGIYQIRATQIATTFQLTQGSPYPRVITPNGAENHRVFWFFDNPSGNPVTGTIYDIRGAQVRGLAVNSQSPTPNCLVWDGRDNRGAVVPSGVYLYKIQAGNETHTGTVVVAR
jgi:hypothetical protein